MNVLGLIPARSGSERIKNKNIRSLAGKPLIAYTIEAALESNVLDRIIVSTNSHEIAEIALKYGAEIPFLRPDDISSTYSTELQFHQHALKELSKSQDYNPDLIVNLYPTCPFRKASSIRSAIKLINENPDADSLRSVRLCTEHPYKMWVLDGSYLKRFINYESKEHQTLSYQLLPKVYIQNACIYISRSATILKKDSTIGVKVISFVMDEFESIDINNELDFMLAEAVMQSDLLKSK